jgi:tRNA(adenine34) deaminase
MIDLSKNDCMRQVIEFAQTIDSSEVPVAAFIVRDNQIIARALNTREKCQDVFGHAELNAIKIAQQKLNSWNLADCQIYISLEPCVMCAGAIAQSHINEIYFAAYDYKFGACGSKFMVFPNSTRIQGGILESEAKQLLEDFFKDKRED